MNNNLETIIRALGGIAATHELVKRGHSSHALTAAVRSGSIVRIRQGHYGCADLSLAEQEAFRVGGRLTGASAARHLGIWAPPHWKLEVLVRRNATELRSRSDAAKRLDARSNTEGTKVIWTDVDAPGTRSVVHALECVQQIARTRSELEAFAAAESAIHGRHFTRAAWIRAVERLPHRLQRRLAHADGTSESGGESIAKMHFMDMQLAFVQQKQFPGIGRVDFLVGNRLIVEIDGAEFHTTVAEFEEDRRRDALLSALGYRVLRFSYRQVERRWPEVEAAMRSAIDRGDHLA